METQQKQKPNQSFTLDIHGIHEYQRNRFPFLMIDKVDEVIPGISARGYKNLTINDWFFDCHFEDDPTMPGMLQLEAIVQLCALTILTLPGNKGKIAYLASADRVKFRRKVLPGDRLNIETQLHTWKRGIGQCSGIATVNEELACEAQFSLVLPDELTRYRLVKE